MKQLQNYAIATAQKEYARKKGQKERAYKSNRGQFGQQADTEEADEPIRNLLKHIAELIVEEKLDSASWTSETD